MNRRRKDYWRSAALASCIAALAGLAAMVAFSAPGARPMDRLGEIALAAIAGISAVVFGLWRR
jgi:ABC-type phosphate transport system permease subunit